MKVMVVISLWGLLSGCVYLPRISHPPDTYARPPSKDGSIAAWLGPSATSVVRASMIAAPREALTARLDLIEAARDHLDLQYFIWQNDRSGVLMIQRLLAAADRGVRVRVLVDDVQLEGLVNKLTALDAHPNVEIRIFNPFSVRWRYQLGFMRLLEFALDGKRLNHRMHNKLMVADNLVAILGGRNIGDDYFGMSPARNFVDLDLLLSGPIVPQLSSGFDQYWNSRWAYPVNRLLNISLVPQDLARLRERLSARVAADAELLALSRREVSGERFAVLARTEAVARWRTFVDDPRVSWFDRPDDLARELTHIALSAQHEVLVVSPYLVPNRALLEIGARLTRQGVRVSALTNSLQTNDVVVAQAAYSTRRKQMLRSGIQLYELRGDAPVAEHDGADSVSLHPKFMLFDHDNIFLGSLNLDPRSLYLNTELGVYLEAPELASSLREYFETLTGPAYAWRLELVDDEAVWRSGDRTRTRTPAKGSWQRLRHWLMQLLPLGGQV